MRVLSDSIREEIIQLICHQMTGLLDERERIRLRQLKEEYGLEEVDQWHIGQRLRQKPEFDYADALEEFRNSKGRKIRKVKRRQMGWRVGIAAAAVVVVAIGIGLLFKVDQKNNLRNSLLTQQIISPGKSVAVITLANGEQLELGKDTQSQCEENGTLLKLDSAVVTYQATPAKSQEIIYNMISIPIGGEYQLVLADGTKVWMNADSKLKYPVAFSGERREVFLEGEAYFEVEKDREHPFIVHTSRGTVKVLGTGFNVRDYREEAKVVTTLVKGSVAYLPSKREKEVLLTPGYQIEDKAGEELRLQQVDVEMYVGWKEGKYIFENVRLEEIMQVLAKWYDVAIFYKREEVKNLHFTGDLERYDNINDFLQFMEVGGNVKFNIQGKTIVIE